jgi:hypothetical protein
MNFFAATYGALVDGAFTGPEVGISAGAALLADAGGAHRVGTPPPVAEAFQALVAAARATGHCGPRLNRPLS